MLIAEDHVVTFDYVLTDEEGDIIDSSEDGPMVYIHGHGEIVPGLEAALLGRKAGDAMKVVVPPEDGYGERAGDEPMRVLRSELPDDLDPEEGMGLGSVAANGQEIVLWIVGVEDDAVFLSVDHPLAGVTLLFDVTIRDVRPATSEELEHGHVHGPDGHHH